MDPLDLRKTNQDLPAVHLLSSADQEPATASAVKDATIETPATVHPEISRSHHRSRRGWLFVNVALVVLILVLIAVAWHRFGPDKAAPVSVLPWPVLFSSPHPTHLITSDPEIVIIQQMSGIRIPLLDYINHNYIPVHTTPLPAAKQLLANIPQGDWADSRDIQIAVNIAELAASSSSKISVQSASKTQISELKSDRPRDRTLRASS